MTRSTLTALFFVALMTVGCASSGEVAIVTSFLPDSGVTLELVETHQEGAIEVELTIEREDGERVSDLYTWPETEAPPRELLVQLAELEAPLLDNARELEWGRQTQDDTTWSGDLGAADAGAEDLSAETLPAPATYVWPELIEEAEQLRLDLDAVYAVERPDTCGADEGFSDCLRAR
ncbi:MAG: hypothetical protein AB8I08_11435 [Sandaracinaceae bacterium]